MQLEAKHRVQIVIFRFTIVYCVRYLLLYFERTIYNNYLFIIRFEESAIVCFIFITRQGQHSLKSRDVFRHSSFSFYFLDILLNGHFYSSMQMGDDDSTDIRIFIFI